MVDYITKDGRPGLLFRKDADGIWLAANQPSLADYVDDREVNHLHSFAVYPENGEILRVVISTGNGQPTSVWLGVAEAEELSVALTIALASAKRQARG